MARLSNRDMMSHISLPCLTFPRQTVSLALLFLSAPPLRFFLGQRAGSYENHPLR